MQTETRTKTGSEVFSCEILRTYLNKLCKFDENVFKFELNTSKILVKIHL